MKLILILLLAIMSALAIFSVYFHSNNSQVEGIYETKPTQSLVSTEPVFDYKEAISKIFIKDFEYIQLSSKEEIVEKLDSLHDYLNCLQNYILNEDKIVDKNAAFDFIKDELDRIEYLCNCYEADYQTLVLAEIEEAKWKKRMEEFPIATTVWLYLTKEMNYNPYVAAGIIGNMMAECGGQTLHLKWWSCNSTGHYGLCQSASGNQTFRGGTGRKSGKHGGAETSDRRTDAERSGNHSDFCHMRPLRAGDLFLCERS